MKTPKTTVYDLLKTNADVLLKLASAGVAIEDYKNIPLYEDFVRLTGEGIKTTAVVFHLCSEYELSERSVWRIIRRFRTTIPG